MNPQQRLGTTDAALLEGFCVHQIAFSNRSNTWAQANTGGLNRPARVTAKLTTNHKRLTRRFHRRLRQRI